MIRILLAEDHPDMQLAIHRLLEEEGATVVATPDGREALARFRTDRFNVVLMGMGEPLHNYDATMKALRMLADEHGLSRTLEVALRGQDRLGRADHEERAEVADDEGRLRPRRDARNLERAVDVRRLARVEHPDAMAERPLEREQVVQQRGAAAPMADYKDRRPDKLSFTNSAAINQ